MTNDNESVPESAEPQPKEAPERPIPETLPTRNVLALLQHLRDSHIQAAYAINTQIEAVFTMGEKELQEETMLNEAAKSYE